MAFKEVFPGDNNYPGLDRGFNQRFSLQDSGKIIVCSTFGEVWEAVTTSFFAYLDPGSIRFISGGHCYEDFVFDTDSNDNTQVVIDLSNLNGIYETTDDDDVGAGYIVVEPGASNWAIQSTLHSKFGLALPGGSCYSVCAGGHIAGGGYGLLSRLHGLTVDYLAGVEMITRDTGGSPYVRSFTPGNDPDGLDWASRGGGGGNFGVVTKYYFRKDDLPKSPENALFLSMPVEWDQFLSTGDQKRDGFIGFLRKYYEACAALPAQAFTLGKFNVSQGPGSLMSILIQVVYGDNSNGVGSESSLTQSQAEGVISGFQSALSTWIPTPIGKSKYAGSRHYIYGHPVSATVDLDTIYDLPYIEMTQLLNGSGENQRGKYKSAYMIDNFTIEEAGAIYDMLTDNIDSWPMPASLDKAQTLIQIDSYGGAVNMLDNTPNDADEAALMNTAIAARDSMLKLQYQTYWKTYDSADEDIVDTEIIEWFNAAYNHIYVTAQSGGSDDGLGFPGFGTQYQGCYFNYPDVQLGVNSGFRSEAVSIGSAPEFFPDIYFGPYVADRLMSIKQSVDPDNFFRFSQSLPLSRD